MNCKFQNISPVFFGLFAEGVTTATLSRDESIAHSAGESAGSVESASDAISSQKLSLLTQCCTLQLHNLENIIKKAEADA